MIHYDPNFTMTAPQILANILLAAMLICAAPITALTMPSISGLVERTVLPKNFDDMHVVKKIFWGTIFVVIAIIAQAMIVLLFYIGMLVALSLFFNRHTVQSKVMDEYFRR